MTCFAQLPKLSACVHAAVALLLPFEWQHIFVPVLPRIWLDYLTAPMPFVVGIHSSMMSDVEGLIRGGGAEDQLVFVMLDESAVRLQGFDASPVTKLPPAPTRRLERRLNALQNGLQQRQQHLSSVAIERSERGEAMSEVASNFGRDVLLGFASFMVSIFGHYRRYLRPPPKKAPAGDSVAAARQQRRSHPSHEAADSWRRAAEFDVEGFLSLSQEVADGGGGVGGASIGDAQRVREFLGLFRGSQV